MMNVIHKIFASPYTYAFIVSFAAFVAAYAANQKIKLFEKHNQTLAVSKKTIITNLEKTIESKDEIIGMVTGGDSYPRLSIGNNYFFLSVNGVYSIPECTVEIVYLKNYLNISLNTTSDYLEKGIRNDTDIKTIYKAKFTKQLSNDNYIFPSTTIKNSH